MDYSKIPTSALLFDELPGLCRCGVDCTDSILREQILAEIDRRIPVPTAPKLDGWQPAETAPIGVRVLVAHRGVAKVAERRDGWWWYSFPDHSYAHHDEPSHWMPLPEVPR